ncbi:MAG: NTP transferase domain-containing protein [Gammaproteobacteria bacterium]|nr:NTP transferase domain-containing protein [Gammaproteobacteria bacterium]
MPASCWRAAAGNAWAGEKGLCRLGGHSLLERALARAAPQTASLLLSFNGDSRSLPACVVPVIPDTVPGFAGPLAGVLAGLEYLRAPAGHALARELRLRLPLVPRDLVQRLWHHAQHEASGSRCRAFDRRLHPVFALWSCDLATPLRDALVRGDMRGAGEFLRTRRHIAVDWAATPFDPFFNINTPDDLAQAEARLASGDDCA